MTGGRWLRIIAGLVAANVVGVVFCFAFVLLFQFPGHVHLRVMEHIKTLAEGDR